MGRFEEYKPVMALTGLQFCYAGVSLSSRATLLHGTSPRVFIVYRQAFATLAILPFAYFSRYMYELSRFQYQASSYILYVSRSHVLLFFSLRSVLKRGKSKRSSLDLRSFTLIFMVSLIGVTINQNLFFEGIYLASSSMGSAMGNLIPAITFLMAFSTGYEKVNIRNIRSIAKILGTILCVAGALSMILLRGPKLLKSESAIPIAQSTLRLSENHQNESLWLLGCLFLFGSTCCWSCWLVLQVPVSACYPDHVSLSAWMCFFSTLQSAVVTFLIETDPNAWFFHSYLELASCLYAGVVASGLAFFVQSWAISKRGPLFSAMFSPLCTVIVTVLACIFLQEEIYVGSLIGGLGVMIGLYVVLWGKAKDMEQNSEDLRDEKSGIKIQIEDSSDTTICKIDMEAPLLSKDCSSFAEEIRSQQL